MVDETPAPLTEPENDQLRIVCDYIEFHMGTESGGTPHVVDATPTPLTDSEKDQLRIVCDYIKFHMGLYLATPSVIVILGKGLNVLESRWCIFGIAIMSAIYLVSGINAGWFMGTYVNVPWDDAQLRKISDRAYSSSRRFYHHWLYWIGLSCGLSGLILPTIKKLWLASFGG